MYNVLLLVAAGICFGSVSTFSMHFIGNQSLVLHHPLEQERGYPSLTLAYASGWTVLSLVVSCTCMIGAFFVMGLEVGWERWTEELFRKRTRTKTTGAGSSRAGGDLGQPSVREGETGDMEITDLSDHALRDRPGDVLVLDKDEVVKKRQALSSDLKKHELKLKLDAVIDKLEWALGWSMIDLGTRQGGRAERRKKQWEETRAEDKNENLDTEARQRETQEDWEGKGSHQEEPTALHIRAPPSDPVASGYDNELLEDDLVPADRDDRSPFDTGRSSRDPPRKLSGREAEEGVIPVSTSSRYARRGSVPNIKLRDRTPLGSPLSADSRGSMFSPTFSFPGPGSTLASQMSTPVTGSTSAGLYPPSSILQGRRASVPVNSLFPRETPVTPYTLARIQSRAEEEGEDPLSGPPVNGKDDTAEQAVPTSSGVETPANVFSGVEKRRTSTASVSFQTDALGDTSMTNLNRLTREDTSRSLPRQSEDSVSTRGRSRRWSKRRSETDKNWITKVKHLLGYDVVTRQEVRKILIAGTICGWGIAGMRESGS